jgi:hypothetical protein
MSVGRPAELTSRPPTPLFLSPEGHDQRTRCRTSTDPFQGGSIMSKDSRTKAKIKRKGKTIKEEQPAKRR